MLDEFREYLVQGNERGAVNALAKATMAAWFEVDPEDVPGQITSARGWQIR